MLQAAPHVSGLLAYLISLLERVPMNFWAYAHAGDLKMIRMCPNWSESSAQFFVDSAWYC